MTSSWLNIRPESDFSLQNIPFAVFHDARNPSPRCASAIGDYVIDLSALASLGLLDDLPFGVHVFHEGVLNPFMELGRPSWRATRQRIQQLFTEGGDPVLKDNEELRNAVLVPLVDAVMHLPARIGDYTDFYSSREHATNVGIMFRGKENALQPNWLHLPVGYHGRASSVVVSGTDIVRPRGQLQKNKQDPKEGSTYGACNLLDFELEMGFFVGGPSTPLGRPLRMDEAEDRIFGLALFNDWSARDIQAWEYVPLGPFTAKNFASTISPWVVTLDALEPFRCPTSAEQQNDPVPLDYIQDPTYSSYDVKLEVAIKPEGSETASVVTRSNLRHLYWTIKQQLVHHTVTGCNLNAGDLLATGTISGQADDSFGSMLELSWRGAREVDLGNGVVRKFLKNGDTVIMRGACESPQGRVGFGECVGKILGDGSYDGMELPDTPVRATPKYYSFKLYSYWRSSCSWRVRIALAMKGIEFEHIPIHLVEDGGKHKQPEYTAVNPQQQLPTLEFTDREGNVHRVTQSLAIIEFLDEAFPHTVKLLPADTLARARARQFAEVINAGIQPLQNLSVLSSVKTAGEAGDLDGRGFAREAIMKGLSNLEVLVGSSHGRFSVGNSVTMADLCLIPQLYNARRFDINVDEFPTLKRIEDACATLAAFHAAHPDQQPDAPKA